MGAPSAKEKASVTARVAALPGMSTADLKSLWRELFDADPPIQNNKPYLINRPAYRIQELAYGGIKPAVRAKLNAMADALDPKAPKQRTDRPVVGTVLIREWKGVEQRVTVVANGFEWQGRRFKSLSAVARAITGTQWNEPAFFGLRSANREAASEDQAEALRYLYPQILRGGSGAGVQLSRRSARGLRGIHRQPEA